MVGAFVCRSFGASGCTSAQNCGFHFLSSCSKAIVRREWSVLHNQSQLYWSSLRRSYGGEFDFLSMRANYKVKVANSVVIAFESRLLLSRIISSSLILRPSLLSLAAHG